MPVQLYPEMVNEAVVLPEGTVNENHTCPVPSVHVETGVPEPTVPDTVPPEPIHIVGMVTAVAQVP